MEYRERITYDRARRLAHRYILRKETDMRSIGVARYLTLAIQRMTKHGHLHAASRLLALNDLLLTKLREKA